MNRLFTALAVALLLVSAVSAQVAVAPAEYPKLQFFNLNGTPCSACTIATYVGGTTTPLATYTDSTGTVTNPTTITLNSAGYPPNQIQLGPFTYKFVFKDALGVTIWTVDNITSLTAIPYARTDRANTFTPKQTMSGGITGLPTPSATTDATNKSYVDAAVGAIVIPNLASPGPIGGATPSTAVFTSETVTNSKVTDITVSTAFTAIGDSITNCFGVVTSSNCFVNRIATAKKWTLTAQGVNGQGISDMSASTFADTFSNSSVTTFLCCVNDMRNNGSAAAGVLSAAQRVSWAASVEANLIQAAIPESQKAYGDSHGGTVGGVTYSGVWTSQGILGNHVFKTTGAGNTATINVYGSTIYLLTLWQAANTSTYKITLDGSDVAFTVNGVSGVTQSTSTGAFTSFNGLSYGPYAYRLSGLTKTLHQIVLNCISADGSNPCYFLMAAAPNGAANQTGPFVYIGDTIRFSATGGIGYAAYGGSDAAVASHNALLRKVQSDLALDGLHVVYVSADANSPNGYYPLDSVNTQADGVHPTDVGHGLLANAFLGEMSGLALPKERGAGQIFRGVPLCTYSGQMANGGCVSGAASGDVGASTSTTAGQVWFGTDGVHSLSRSGNNFTLGGNGISLLRFGGVGATFPAFKFAGGSPATITVRASDDSADANIQAAKVTVSGATAGKAACIRADKSIGMCSTTVDASGNCTCP